MTGVEIAYTLHHDPNVAGEDAEGPCLPRVSLDCAGCTGSFVFCHLSPAVLRAYVDPTQPRWRCLACRRGA